MGNHPVEPSLPGSSSRRTRPFVFLLVLAAYACADGPSPTGVAELSRQEAPASVGTTALEICGESVSISLLAGQDEPVGEVEISNDETRLAIAYTLAEGWKLESTKVQLATSVEGFPRTSSGNPIPGLFSQQTHHQGGTTFTHVLPLPELEPEGQPRLLVAAYAAVVHSTSGRTEGAWSHGQRFTERGNWATFTEYPLQTCEDSGPRFVTTWDTRLTSGTTIFLPLAGEVDALVDWGDGTVEPFIPLPFLPFGGRFHTYQEDGVYTVTVTGTFEIFGGVPPTIQSTRNVPLLSVDEWGETQTTSLALAFPNAPNLVRVASPPPTVTDMTLAFWQNPEFNADIGHWDTSNVTSMRGMFRNAQSFNSDIGQWDVGNVADMSRMFDHASSFNQDIGSWDVSKVTDMSRMFQSASEFDRDLDSWNTSQVTTMQSMFVSAHDFNGAVGGWDVSRVENMQGMFDHASSFNQPIGTWDVSGLQNMGVMFRSAAQFNQDIGGWNVSNVEVLRRTFADAESFDQDIGSWDVSAVTDFTGLFSGARSFNQDIGGWDVSRATSMNSMFSRATAFNQDIGDWDVSGVGNMAVMFFEASSFNQDLSRWCVVLIEESPVNFDAGAVAWLNPDWRPLWGTCPG